MLTKGITCVAVALPLSLFAMTSTKDGSCPDGKKHYRAAIRHIESGGIGYDKGYTTLETFLASDPSQWRVTPFLDVRGHVFNNGKWAANAGAGVRALLKNRAYGINTYYDYRNTDRFHSNQIGLGLETLGKLWDFRMNGYLPVGKKISAPYNTRFEAFSGNHLLISQKYKSAMKGANAEVGFHFGKSQSFDFYAAAGPYYFIGDVTRATWGGKGRLSGTFKERITLEISDSYDRTFHNKFQGQISLNFPFGPKSKVKAQSNPCQLANTLNDRMLQPVDRQEIIVIDKARKTSAAINPATGLPYFFIFVDNTSSSNGTYASPFHTLTQAQDNSSINDIIYVFPGDGTTTGMNSGIFLKANQKLWGSGAGHLINTTAGAVSIPAQTTSLPTITNTNLETEGDAVTLATNNAVSGLRISGAGRDGIYGADPQSLDVSSCIIEGVTTFAIEALFSGDATISLKNNQFLDNANGPFFSLNGTSSLVCSDNTFTGQTSVSNSPLEIAADSNGIDVLIENNLFDHNEKGSILFNLTNVASANINVLNNTMTHNNTGSASTLGSNFVIMSNGTIDKCTIALKDNVFSNNTSNSLYMHTDGTITTLDLTASNNTMSNNGGSALVLATPIDHLTLIATDNTLSGLTDNGIAIINESTITGTITLNNNTITTIGNQSNGIAITKNFVSLDLTLLNNDINGCEGTGILVYANTGTDSLTATVSENTISNCQNLSSNASPGLDLEHYLNLAGSITNNTLSDNIGVGVVIGSDLTSPTTCITLTGNNSSTDYLLVNPIDGTFNLSPCDASSLNVGTINTSGTIQNVQSCPDATPCPP